MNDERRKRLAKAEALVQEATGLIWGIEEEEALAYGNVPEPLENSAQADALRQSLDLLQKIKSCLDQAEAGLAEFELTKLTAQKGAPGGTQ